METQITATTAIRPQRFEAMVQRLYLEQPGLQGYEGTLESVIRNQFAQMGGRNHTWKRNSFRRLLLHIYAKKCYAVLRNPAYVEVLANISAFGNKTVHEIEDWRKDSLTAEGQLASMIRHLFAQYDVPEFMEFAFAQSNKVHMLWYVQLGRGDRVQDLSAFPVQFTNRMAHEFRQTPACYTIEQAIRRAQALGFGAAANTAEAIAWATTVEEIQDTAFRAAAIQFVANAGEVKFDTVQQVVGYLAVMHRDSPDYSLKGRTMQSVTRQAAEYYVAVAKRKAAETYDEWSICGVKDYELEEENHIFRIVQLATSEALYDEGEAMEHCVAEYAYDCGEGTSAIFSLRRFTRGQTTFERIATFEVNPLTGEIVQAKGMYNDDISAEAEVIVTEWAAREQLIQAYSVEEVHLPAAQQPGVQWAVQQRAAYRANDTISTANIVRIVLFILKILYLLSKMK